MIRLHCESSFEVSQFQNQLMPFFDDAALCSCITVAVFLQRLKECVHIAILEFFNMVAHFSDCLLLLLDYPY